MNPKRNKLIIEALGGCWHEYECTTFPHLKCKKCNRLEIGVVEDGFDVDLSTPDGFFWAWDRAKEKEWWPDFLLYLFEKRYGRSSIWAYRLVCVDDIDLDTFANNLAEFLEGRK